MTNPWFEAFRRGPKEAVADLFSGRAGVGASMRLDIPELLYDEFPPNLIHERKQLDQALMSWLLDMREDYASQVKRLGFPAYGKRVGDCLIALQLLDLPEAKSRMRADLGAWLRWLLPLRLAPERDPALECFRLLTRDQPDGRHTALWLRLAADPRPEYLTVALAGLQLLPNEDNAQRNQTLMLQALLHLEEAGRARLSALWFFPRGPQHWNPVLEEALSGFQNQTQEHVATELADTLRTTLFARYRYSSPRQAPVKQEEWEGLQDDIVNSGDQPETTTTTPRPPATATSSFGRYTISVAAC